MSAQDSGSQFYVPAPNTDAFPLADHTSTTTLALSQFATTKRVLLRRIKMINGGAAATNIIIKDVAGITLLTVVYDGGGTSTAIARDIPFPPNGLEMGAGFSVNTGAADWSVLVEFAIP